MERLYGGSGREELIGAAVRHLNPDVAIFTEARATASFDAIADIVGPYRARSGGPRDRECTVIASRWPIVRSAPIGPPWARRKWIIATTQPGAGVELTVAGVHLTPHLLWPFELLRGYEVSTLLSRLANTSHHVVAGDFNALRAGDGHRLSNAPWWVRAQWLLQAGTTPRWAIERFIGAGYLDCYRARNPEREKATRAVLSPNCSVVPWFPRSTARHRTTCPSGPTSSATTHRRKNRFGIRHSALT